MAEAPFTKKFMFERSFDGLVAGGNAVVRERRPVTLTPEQYDNLKRDAYDSGFTAGQKAGADEHAKLLGLAMNRIETRIAELVQNAVTEKPRREMRVREAALAIARKILPDFTAGQGLSEIQAILDKTIGEMTGEPRLVMRVNESQFDAVNERMKIIAEKQAFAGKVVLLADAEVPAGDCRIEWADGGIERNLHMLWQNIQKTVAPGSPEMPLAPEISSDPAGTAAPASAATPAAAPAPEQPAAQTASTETAA